MDPGATEHINEKGVKSMKTTFHAALRTPKGIQNGMITFIEDNGTLRGSISALGRKNYFKNGKKSGKTFELSGTLSAGFYSLGYTATGTFDNDTLSATASTKIGTFQITGTRMNSSS